MHAHAAASPNQALKIRSELLKLNGIQGNGFQNKTKDILVTINFCELRQEANTAKIVFYFNSKFNSTLGWPCNLTETRI